MFKLTRLWEKLMVLGIVAFWGLAHGPILGASKKLAANSQQAFRDAKMRQDVERRAVELQRQQILADSAAKFDEREGSNPYSNLNHSYNWRYHRTTRNYGNQRYGNSASNRQRYNSYSNSASNHQQYRNPASTRKQ